MINHEAYIQQKILSYYNKKQDNKYTKTKDDYVKQKIKLYYHKKAVKDNYKKQQVQHYYDENSSLEKTIDNYKTSIETNILVRITNNLRRRIFNEFTQVAPVCICLGHTGACICLARGHAGGRWIPH